MSFRSIKVTVGGQELLLAAGDSDSEEYILKVAEQADDRINKLLENNDKLSTLKAAAMACVILTDELNKAVETSDNMREEVQTYTKENTELRSELAALRRNNKKAEES